MKGEKRRFQSVRLLRPCEATADGKRAFVVEMSLHSVRSAHQVPPGKAGDVHEISFEWEGRTAAVKAELLSLDRRQKAGKTLYEAEYEIVEGDHASREVMRDIVLHHVLRALDEQKANARGIPAVAAHSFQTGAAREYLRHEYIGGKWREMPTEDSRQPMNGFTVGADHSRDEIDMLREAWAAGDKSVRSMIRKMAELSVSTPGGIPTRRYNP